MTNILSLLQEKTKIAADTIDLKTIKLYKINDVTTNPSLILNSIVMPEYTSIINKTILMLKKTNEQYNNVLYDYLTLIIATKILQFISGKISIEIDPRLSYNTNASIKKAKNIIELYNNSGIKNNQILIKLAATWEGIKAAEQLEKDGINCNLTLIFSFIQAKACAEAGVCFISPFVGRILDWYKNNTDNKKYTILQHPGIICLKEIFNYYKTNNYKTNIMGASFRDINEIIELAGCDYLTIPPHILYKLNKKNGKISNNMYINYNYNYNINYTTRNIFLQQLNNNQMAKEELKIGINKFIVAQKQLESYIQQHQY
uniref:transaldolase n=1 Tax=Candidatus Aschnera chinzeii TaxID=1485666 RepID=A0AAT9G3U6_9ENTR|nr:MAG: transaldolase [Candidatus Aschnera chinzeii]